MLLPYACHVDVTSRVGATSMQAKWIKLHWFKTLSDTISGSSPFVAQVERAMCSMYHDTNAMRLRPTMDAFIMKLFHTLS